MRALQLRTAAIALVAAVGLGGCAYGPFGGMSVGYGNGGYYDPYYGGYSSYGSRYGTSPYWGWYDGFYYPGAGYYVYDRYRNPYYWSDSQRRYWTVRRKDPSVKEVWVDFARDYARNRSTQAAPSATTSTIEPATTRRVERVRTTRTEPQRASRPVRVERRSRTTTSSSTAPARERRVIVRERTADDDD